MKCFVCFESSFTRQGAFFWNPVKATFSYSKADLWVSQSPGDRTMRIIPLEDWPESPAEASSEIPSMETGT